MSSHLIIDAHQDLAWNMLVFGRDYTRPALETRHLEEGSAAPALERQGHTLLGWAEYQCGRVAVVFGTLFVTPGRLRKEWETIYYITNEEAHVQYRKQIDTYHELVERHADRFRLIGSRADLESLLTHWEDGAFETHPVGIVPLMEGAEGIRSPEELDLWWQTGVRIIGLAWAGTRFCGGTREPGPLTDDGHRMLKAMAEYGYTLDISHMDEQAARQSLDLYPGPVIASHANAAAIIPEYSGNRHLSDAVIKALIGRGGIIGLIPSCRFLDNRWQRGGLRTDVPMTRLVDQVDHICQLAGNSNAVGLGTDFDGGFGVEAVPAELDTIADLQKLVPLLAARGYNDEEISAIMGGNWKCHLQAALPA